MVAEDNPFVRFKNHIDSNIRRGWDVLFGSSVDPSSSSTTSSSAATATKTIIVSTSPPSISPPSSLDSKMPDTSSTRASNASTSDQHTTSPASPTSSVAPSTIAASVTTADDVHTWAVHSPYSPLNLQHLRQPTPRDAPRACDGLFTFRDAFEDLLVAGSGEPLPAAQTVGWRKCWQGSDRFPHARVNAANWVNGLGVLGLWDAYFSLESGTGRDMYRDDRDRFQKRMRYREAGPWVSVSGPGVRVGVEGWGRERGEVARAHFDAKGVWDGAWRSRWEVEGEDRRDRDGEADVEDELYRASESTADSDSTARDVRVAVVPRRPFASSPPETTTTVYADGSRRVTKTERIERDGRTEILTTEHHYDAHGNLLSESHGTSKTQTWSGSLPGASAGASFSWSWNSRGSKTTTQEGENNASEGEADGDGNGNWGDRKDGKSGWFWQR